MAVPVWALQAALAFFPFLFVYLACVWADRRSSVKDMATPLIASGASVVVASICWTAALVWSLLR